MARGAPALADRGRAADAGAVRRRLQLLLPARQPVHEEGRGRAHRRAAVLAKGRRRAAGRSRPRHRRAAVSEVLARGGKDSSLPWENPYTGARGTITPLTSADNQDGGTCRDMSRTARSPGCRARPAAPSAAGGKCAACGRGSGRDRPPHTLTDVMIPRGKISSGLAW
ncbi:MAG: RT0821/Lpp0805 family surface protein [Xanthobacteraceae bacterium]